MTAEPIPFQAEVSRLLDIVTHALYSDREVFLRELVSNAADACDRHRILSLTDADSAGPTAGGHRIALAIDTVNRRLTVSDNGIGMSAEELRDNLGTIARSGTSRFLAQLDEAARRDASLIGQFGVGFYASFMVAREVAVISRRAGASEAWCWRSDGAGSFTVTPAEREVHGTDVVLQLKEDAEEFVDPYRLKAIIRRYSDHIAIPIVLMRDDGAEETLNSASALWTRPRSEITDELAERLFRQLSHGMGKPWATIHSRTEGALEFSALLFIPEQPPVTLFDPERKHGVQLYVRRVFITADCRDLVPGYLRFLTGVVDSSDLPLNVSRELLQNNPMLTKIRQNLVRKVLGELQKRAEGADYDVFWRSFGAVLKEGMYEDFENRATLLKLARFRTTASDGLTSLDAYVARMKPGQDAIYTLSGEDGPGLLKSPQLEGFKARGIEVLLLTDAIDEFWTGAVGAFDSHPLQSITSAGADLSAIETAVGTTPDAETAPGAAIAPLVALLKVTLGDAVKDVRESARLTDSAVCLVSDEGDVDLRLERLLRQHQRLDATPRRVLEINPRHPLIEALLAQIAKPDAAAMLADAAWLLLDEARLLQGEPLPDPSAFARRLESVLRAQLSGPL